MRTFAWLLVVVGILIAVVGALYVNDTLAALLDGGSMSAEYAREKRRALEGRPNLWPPIIAGACLTAFGILLLAVRPPRLSDRISRRRSAA